MDEQTRNAIAADYIIRKQIDEVDRSLGVIVWMLVGVAGTLAGLLVAAGAHSIMLGGM